MGSQDLCSGVTADGNKILIIRSQALSYQLVNILRPDMLLKFSSNTIQAFGAQFDCTSFLPRPF